MPRLLVCLACALFCGLAAAQEPDLPAQFKAWGTRGPELPPLEAGWTEIPAEPNKRELAQPQAADVARGCVLFKRHVLAPVYHDSIPAWHEMDVKLQAFATPGEYEPLSFAFYALEDLKHCKISVGECKNKEGARIPANHFDVRFVRSIRWPFGGKNNKNQQYQLLPFLLEKMDNYNLRRAETGQAWITVKLPSSAKAGDYEGKITFQAEGKAAAEIPLQLRVLPFTLPKPPIDMGISYARPHPQADIRSKERIDQAEHGIIRGEVGCGIEVVSRDRTFGPDDEAAARNAVKAALARVPKGEPPAIRFSVGHQIIYFWDKQKEWFVYWPAEKVTDDFLKVIKLIDDEVKAGGGAEISVFIMDEPGGHPELLNETARYNKLIKEKFPHIKTWCTIGGGLSQGIDEIGILGPYLDEMVTNRFTPDICKRLVERRKSYGIYNGGFSASDRFFYGYYGWKTNASMIFNWVYAFGTPWKDPIRGNHGYVYHAEDGPLPSLHWETVREGIDDYRYMDLLWRLVTVARKSSDAGAAPAVKAAEALTAEMMSQIEFNFQMKGSGSGSKSVPSLPTLEKWRWKTALAIQELLTHVPLDKALATPAERPGPLELPGPTRDEATVKYGAELIAQGDFEAGPGPFKLSAKKGSGGVDKHAQHGGAQSFKVENPADSDGTTVAVCIWGWGGSSPSMTLESGKTYEFSAWIKSGTAPRLRFDLPADSSAKEQSGETPEDAAGWKRVYKRVLMTKSAKPKALGIWLQGPGTLWCDDISLREVELPPFALKADHTILDSGDRAVAVQLSCNAGDEVKVRLKLPGSTEEKVVALNSAKPAFVEFNAAGLSTGWHELKADLVGQNGTAFSKTLTFQRIRGPFER